MELEGELGPGSSTEEGMCSHIRSVCAGLLLELSCCGMRTGGLASNRPQTLKFAFLHHFRCHIPWLSLCQSLIFNCYAQSMLESFDLQC